MGELVRCDNCGFTCSTLVATSMFITVVTPLEHEGVLNFCGYKCLHEKSAVLLRDENERKAREPA